MVVRQIGDSSSLFPLLNLKADSTTVVVLFVVWPFGRFLLLPKTALHSAACWLALPWSGQQRREKLPQTSNTVSKTCCQQRRPLKSKASGHCSGDLLNNFSFSVKCARHILQLIVDWLSFSDTQTHMKKKMKKRQNKKTKTDRQTGRHLPRHTQTFTQTDRKSIKNCTAKGKQTPDSRRQMTLNIRRHRCQKHFLF